MINYSNQTYIEIEDPNNKNYRSYIKNNKISIINNNVKQLIIVWVIIIMKIKILKMELI